MKSQKNAADNSNELEWLAFCYLADELDEAERSAFEQRLEHDEQAQNSLVVAMQESQLIFASLNSTSFNDQKRVSVSLAPQVSNTLVRKRFGVLVASAAAILLVAGSWVWLSNPASNSSDAIASTEPDRLAFAWVDTLDLMNDAELDEFPEDESFQNNELNESSDWMLVALTDLSENEVFDAENEGESYQ